MGNWYWIVGGVRPTNLGFWSEDLLLCWRHSRGILLQPFTSVDEEAGFGKRGCPFCKGGELRGQFHKYRSRKRLIEALNTLSPNPAFQ